MPASDNYAEEILGLRQALASGVLTVEANGRRKTYRSNGEIETALKYFEGLALPNGGRRRTRFMRASIGSN